MMNKVMLEQQLDVEWPSGIFTNMRELVLADELPDDAATETEMEDDLRKCKLPKDKDPTKKAVDASANKQSFCYCHCRRLQQRPSLPLISPLREYASTSKNRSINHCLYQTKAQPPQPMNKKSTATAASTFNDRGYRYHQQMKMPPQLSTTETVEEPAKVEFKDNARERKQKICTASNSPQLITSL